MSVFTRFLGSSAKRAASGQSIDSLRALSPFFGSVAGGIYGYGSSENLDTGARLQDAAMGAAAGFGIGALATKTFWRGVKGVGKSIKAPFTREYNQRLARARNFYEGPLSREQMKNIWRDTGGERFRQIGRGAVGAGKTALTFGAKVARGALNNPYTALTLGGGVYGLSAMMGQGGPGVANDVGAMMERDKISSTGVDNSRQMWEASTVNLVQGLHRGRHG